MKPRIANIFAVMSLLLLIGTASLWLRSYLTGDYLSIHTVAGDRWSISSANGTLMCERQSNVIYNGTGVAPPTGLAYKRLDPSRYRFSTRKWLTPTQWRFAGFGLVINEGTVAQSEKSARPGAWRNTVVLLPLWPLVLILSIPLGLRIRSVACARRNTRLRLCLTCGYDLRATPERCPECGTFAAIAK